MPGEFYDTFFDKNSVYHPDFCLEMTKLGKGEGL